MRIRIPAIGVDARIAPVDSHFHPDTGEWDPIEPPTDTLDDLTHLVVWWRQRAALSRPSTGTAYVFGHSCARMSCVFDRLHELRQGDRVEITTANGDYDLRVTSTAAENTSSKNDADTDATVMSRLYATYRVPDRVVLMTCGYVGPRSAANSPVNLAVVAEVVAAHPAG